MQPGARYTGSCVPEPAEYPEHGSAHHPGWRGVNRRFRGEVALVSRPALTAAAEAGTAGFLKPAENTRNRPAAKLGRAYKKYRLP